MSKSRVCPKCLCMIYPWSFEWRGLCDYCVVPCKCPYVPGEHFAAKGNHCGVCHKIQCCDACSLEGGQGYICWNHSLLGSKRLEAEKKQAEEEPPRKMIREKRIRISSSSSPPLRGGDDENGQDF